MEQKIRIAHTAVEANKYIAEEKELGFVLKQIYLSDAFLGARSIGMFFEKIR